MSGPLAPSFQPARKRQKHIANICSLAFTTWDFVDCAGGKHSPDAVSMGESFWSKLESCLSLEEAVVKTASLPLSSVAKVSEGNMGKFGPAIVVSAIAEVKINISVKRDNGYNKKIRASRRF